MNNEDLKTITESYAPLLLKELVDLCRAFPGLPLQEQKSIISELVLVHPTLNLKWGKGRVFRRVRPFESCETPSNIRELIWRTDISTPLRRANPAGFPILYLADHRDTAFSEVNTDDFVALTEFEILQSKTVRFAPIGEFSLIQRTGRGILTPLIESLHDMLNDCAPDKTKSLLITDSFLFRCLSDDDYCLSSHVAMCIFEKSPISVIAYPSIRQRGGVCFAVRTENFSANWGVRSVSFGKALHLAEGYHDYEDIKRVSGIFCNGDLFWEASSDKVDSVNVLEPLYSLPPDR